MERQGSLATAKFSLQNTVIPLNFFLPCNRTFLMDETVHLEQFISLSVSSLSSVLVLSGNVLTCKIFLQRLRYQPRNVRVL